MLNSRTNPHPEASSAAKRGAILVGIQADTLEVKAVIVRSDGTMSFRGRTCLVPAGRTAVGEAITTMGLTRLRSFRADDIGDALKYARRLDREMQDDTPQIL